MAPNSVWRNQALFGVLGKSAETDTLPSVASLIRPTNCVPPDPSIPVPFGPNINWAQWATIRLQDGLRCRSTNRTATIVAAIDFGDRQDKAGHLCFIEAGSKLWECRGPILIIES